MGRKILISGMEFEGKEAAAIVNGAEALARAITKVAAALDGVKKEIARMGEKNAMFYAELIRAGAIAEEFAEADKRYSLTALQESTLRETFMRDQKIQAIKTVREATGLGLKDSKDMVDSFWGGMNGGIEGILRLFRRTG